MNIDMDYIKTEAAKQCYWLKDGVFNLPEWTRAMMQIAADRAGSKINSMKRDLDACRPYLKEGETAADALERLSNHSNSSGLSWNGHNIYGDADSIKEARDAIEYKASRFAAFAAKLWPDEDIDAPTTKETT